MGMLSRKFFLVFAIIGSYGCASNPNYYQPSCNFAEITCLGLAVVQLKAGNTTSQKCSDMPAEKRALCEQHVVSLKKHIEQASKK